MADVAGVESAGLVDVVGALDDGAAVGEDGELVAVGGELQQEAVVAYVAVDLEMMGQFLEVEAGGAAVRDLDGVAAAETDRVRALLAFEPRLRARLSARLAPTTVAAEV